MLVALPALTILALLLEANTRGPWLETAKSRYTVLGLGFALATVCLSICIYITSRLGGKMWSGAIPADGSGPHYSYYVSKPSTNSDTICAIYSKCLSEIRCANVTRFPRRLSLGKQWKISRFFVKF